MNILTDRIKIEIRHSATLLAAVAVYLFSLYAMPLFGEHSDIAEDPKASGVSTDEKNEAASKDKWVLIKSDSFEIYCDPEVDLQSVARKLSRRGLFPGGIYGHSPTGTSSEKVAYLLDRLLGRAREILDMYPDMPKITIKIFKDRDALNEEYFRMFGKRPDFKSFYIYPLETIYTCEWDISDSVMVHEMGHATLDHYFSTILPPKIAELLASYVDKHLED